MSFCGTVPTTGLRLEGDMGDKVPKVSADLWSSGIIQGDRSNFMMPTKAQGSWMGTSSPPQNVHCQEDPKKPLPQRQPCTTVSVSPPSDRTAHGRTQMTQNQNVLVNTSSNGKLSLIKGPSCGVVQSADTHLTAPGGSAGF